VNLNLSQASAQRQKRYFLLNNKAVNSKTGQYRCGGSADRLCVPPSSMSESGAELANLSGLLGAFNHTCLIPLNRSLVAGNGTLTWYDEQLDGPLGYGACADSSILGAVLILLVVLIATSSRSGGGVASRAFEYTGYKATLPTAPKGPKPTKKQMQQLKERAQGAALV